MNDMSPVTRSYLTGAVVGASVGAALYVWPFVPLNVAAVAALGVGAVTVLFVRSLIDPDFLLPERDVVPWAGEDRRIVAAPDGRYLREMAPPRGRLRLRQSDGPSDSIPVRELLVASRRAGGR